MKRIYFGFFLAFSTTIFADSELCNMKINKNSPFLSYSADFNILKNDIPNGKIVRTGFMCPRYYYEIYDEMGMFQARGVTRFFSLGFFSPALADIDIYDANENYLGLIQGKLLSRSRVKFIFYDQGYNELFEAFFDKDSSDIVIYSHKTNLLADIKGITYGEVGVLNVDLINDQIDERLIKIFSAFVSDYFEVFLNDDSSSLMNDNLKAISDNAFDVLKKSAKTSLN